MGIIASSVALPRAWWPGQDADTPLPSLGCKPLPPRNIVESCFQGLYHLHQVGQNAYICKELLRKVLEGLYFRTAKLCPSPDLQYSAEAKYLNHINLAQALICRVLAGQPQEISTCLLYCAKSLSLPEFTWSVPDLMAFVGQGVAKWAE